MIYWSYERGPEDYARRGGTDATGGVASASVGHALLYADALGAACFKQIR